MITQRATTWFWKQVRKTEGCWEWVGKVRSWNGYARMKVGGHRTAAHRFSWELHFGAIPDGLGVLHKCDNRICVRPDHLFLGTALDNAEDRDRKGRQTWGPEYADRARKLKAKLTQEQVEALRAEYVAGGISQRALAKKYGVGKSAVGAIYRGETWNPQV